MSCYFTFLLQSLLPFDHLPLFYLIILSYIPVHSGRVLVGGILEMRQWHMTVQLVMGIGGIRRDNLFIFFGRWRRKRKITTLVKTSLFNIQDRAGVARL